MTTTTFLRGAEFVTSIATNSAVLSFSFSAYRRTNLRAFAFWIWSCAIAIILMSAWYIMSFSPPSTRTDYLTFTIFYRILFMVNSILGATGSIMIVRHFLSERDRKDRDAAHPAGTCDVSRPQESQAQRRE
jgi:hypothetical protein